MKNTSLMMPVTRNGTMVRIKSVATKKIAPIRAKIFAIVMEASAISTKRWNSASEVRLLASSLR
jgi:hypothetical protein